MVTKRHKARRIALQLLYNCDLTNRYTEQYLFEQLQYLTFEEVMVESIASEMSEEEVEKKVREIAWDKEKRQWKGWRPRPQNEEIRALGEFALELAQGTLEFRKMIDERLSSLSEHWRLDRMSVVDRNILRLSAYEILFRPDIPPKVSIDEAVELAKEYSDEKSSGFVNGILDALAVRRLQEKKEKSNPEQSTEEK